MEVATKVVKMKVAIRVYPDGIHPETVSVGQVISLPVDLADGLIRDKMAVLPDPPKVPTKAELDAIAKQQEADAKANEANSTKDK
jgi:hypothetical protein